MIRTLLLPIALLCCTVLSAQTYFYMDEIVVDPQPATTADDISINLIGNLSGGGAYIVAASAQVTGTVVTVNIVAADVGGITVLVPHTETVALGQLPAGQYTIVINGPNVADFAPSPQHLFEVVGGGPTACDSLQIASVHWQAFSDTAIVVHVFNTSTTLFDYPNFILFDENGDTLAVETVNFFGIAGESYHILRLHPNGTVPNAPYYGTLQLWTGFTTDLACEWLLFIDLCPPGECATLMPTVTNIGGGISIGTYNWSIFDEDFNLAATGSFEMTDVMQYDNDTICLPPGNYSMTCDVAQPPIGGGQPWFSVATEGWISGPSQPVSLSLPVPMPFAFYEPCADATNNIAEATAAGITVQHMGDALLVQRADGAAIGALQLLDAQGRTMLSAFATANSTTLHTNGFASGVYLLRTIDGILRVMIARQ